MQRLNKNIEALVASYGRYGLVNQTGGSNLPSRDSIEDILHGLDELIFPGFRENEGLDHDNLQFITAERVYHIARELIREVEKSLVFSYRKPDSSEGEKNACGSEGCHAAAELIVNDFFDELPQIRYALALDMKAAFKGDPAAKSTEEVIVSYPGFEAITVHRLAHFFWVREVPLIPRIMSELVHGSTGIDIHPGAQIGESFFIDHGTGVVIGETTVIGKNVKLYQGVTLGALSVKKEEADKKRHPTIEDDVTIYSGATILGGQTVIGRGCTIGGNVWLTESVPPYTMVYTKTDQVVKTR
ncbi:serine acetyltransferase [Treponema sp. TIM-1]|uniref:serine O-acetyltransferase EpsC n=1 Tax=Treponema sp. TIM-1 TaxID=2898417 RepID=UPI00397F8F6D